MKFRCVSLAILLLLLALPAWAQDAETVADNEEAIPATVADDQEEIPATVVDDEEEIPVVEEIVVTGSRLKRTTYTSISPLQVITAAGQQEVGLVDAGSILQKATVASGQQIDLTFGGFVLDNGPASSTANFRGLGSNRTLILVNGRRLAPSGVEGAPSSPNLNLIPAILVQQYDLLLDGASSVYGSDAVAGVANVIMRKDFDGLELSLFNETPDQGAGEDVTFSAAWGKDFDRGFVGIGLEYNKGKPVTFDDRRWTAGCDRHREVDQDGKINSVGLFNSLVYGMPESSCKNGLLSRRVFIPVDNIGSIYYTPGRSNGGWNDFSESSFAGRFGVDGDGDGVTDVNFADYSLNGAEPDRQIFPEFERFSVMAYGEYTFDGEMNITPFFEALHARIDVSIRSDTPQLFPDVPAANPFNICNPDGVRGVDCGLATDALYANPNFIQSVVDAFGRTPAQLGILQGALGPLETTPIVAVRGDRVGADVEIEQSRLVLGLRGDLPLLNFGSFSDWSFELSFAYNHSKGTSRRVGIHEGRLNLSLATTIEDPNNPGRYICGVDANSDGIPDGTDGCVPIDMFAPSLYRSVIGDFATQAERDYLFVNRDFDTTYTQSIVSGFISGTVFALPAGNVNVGFGVELRDDEIRSIPNEVARDGLIFGFFSDGGATGKKYTRELYAEMDIPLLANRPGVAELQLNLSARHTKDEYYDAAQTYSIKLGYRPVESLLLRFTRGTSFRAPNLRENFLRSQTGFLNLFDPCFIPEDALSPLTGYNPDADDREPEVLANCLANGADPTMLDNGGNNVYSVEISTGGLLDLDAETSDSFSYGLSFQQPFTDFLDVLVGATYYKIRIEGAIIEPSPRFIVNDCYTKITMDSIFCSRIQRDDDGFFEVIDGSFLNRDQELVRGVDVNVLLEKTVTLFNRAFDLSVGITATHTLERSITNVNADDTFTYEDFRGNFGVPEWRVQYNFSAEYGKYRFIWQIDYLSAVSHDLENLDPMSDITGSADTCAPPNTCRDVAEVDAYRLHSASLYYYGDVWTIGGGLRNVFDKAPPMIDSSEVGATINNVPVGYGYDVSGRTLFLTVTRNF